MNHIKESIFRGPKNTKFFNEIPDQIREPMQRQVVIVTEDSLQNDEESKV